MGKLTDTRIKGFKPRASAYQVSDGSGLVLEVRPGPQKAWLYRYRLHGRQEKLSLGLYPKLSLAEARKRHFEAQQLVASGKSAARLKQEEKRRLSDDLQCVRGLAKAYIEDYLSKLTSGAKAQAYIQKQVLPSIGNKLLHEVTPSDCVAIVETVKRRGAPAVARKILEQLRGLFGYAVDRHLLAINPAAQVRAAKIVGARASRDRTLQPDEIKRFLDAAEKFPTSQANRIAFRLILLTLCRKGELVKARWDHIDFERGEWRIPVQNAKNRQEHVVYLSTQARELFKELRELAGRSPWVLPGRNLEDHISITTLNQVTFVTKQSDKSLAWLDDVRIHDLRRTASTQLHEAGFPSDVIEKALAHTIAGVRGVYNRAEYSDQRRAMLQQWADMVDSWVNVKGANVVALGLLRAA
ncbi:MAG: tyrosine-type recombinase/integrase [Burkholderiales bacterium]|nr:tyrosine-type recombinase/integrase [Burkholderiales bacterium]